MKKWILILPVLFLLVTPAYAADVSSDLFEASAAVEQLNRSLSQKTRLYLSGTDTLDLLCFTDNLLSIIRSVFSDVKASVSASLSGITKIFLIAVICSFASGLYDSKRFDVVTIAGSAAILSCAAGDLSGLGMTAKDAVESMYVFSKALLPVMTAASAASGALASSGIRHTLMLFLTDVVITAIRSVLLPLTYSCIMVAGANAICGNDILTKMVDLCRNLISWTLKTVLTIYTTVLGLSGIIIGSVDAVTAKAVRLTVSSTLPVVGGIVADVSETILAGAVIAKNTVGVFGILAVFATVLTPVVLLGVQYLSYKIASALAGFCVKGELIRLIDTIGSAFGLLLGMTGSCALLLLVTIISSIPGGVS